MSSVCFDTVILFLDCLHVLPLMVKREQIRQEMGEIKGYGICKVMGIFC